MDLLKKSKEFEAAHIEEFGEIDGIVFFNGEEYDLCPHAKGFAEFHQLQYKINVSWSVWLGYQIGDYRLYPVNSTDAIKKALGYMCFDLIAVAEVYRGLGFEIPRKAEEEQAFFLHRFIILALEHGDNFISVFNAETKALVDQKNSKGSNHE